MTKEYINKYECRCCGSKNLKKYLDLGNQPLANSYHKNNVVLSKIPLSVNVCQECFNSQLTVVVDPKIMFKHYLYVSGTTKTFKEHCHKFAKDTLGIVNKSTPKVLDIACNDGTLLKEFKELGSIVYGIDPAENIRTLSEESEIDVCVDFWNEKSSKHFNTKFDIITGTNVFAHVDDAKGFLELAKTVIEDDGKIVIEFPYCSEMIKHNEFDTIYHEHVSYFLVNSIKTLSDSIGLTITDIITSDIHGGSIRFYFSIIGTETNKVSMLIDLEKLNGLLNICTYDLYQSNVDLNKVECVETISEYVVNGYEIISYGASAKGNTMLNYFDIKLEKVIDDNPLKIGYYTPGKDVEIVSSDYITNASDKLLIILTAWNFSTEIIERVNAKQRKGQDIKFLFYVPSVKVI